jgi:arylsulfatase A-like enzyme
MSSFVRDDRIAEQLEVVEVLPTLTRDAVAYIASRAEASQAGEPFFLYFPISSPHTPIVPAEAWKGKGKIGTYADFVAQTDGCVGEIMEALNRHDLAKNTILMVIGFPWLCVGLIVFRRLPNRNS